MKITILCKRLIILSFVAVIAILLVGLPGPVAAQGVGTAFTYQGRLTDSGSPANGENDFEFKLFGAETGGTQVGSTLTRDNVTVTDGFFGVELDFGDVFNGDSRWLEIAVRPGASTGSYTALSPRQRIAAAPYAFYAGGAGSLKYLPTGSDTLAEGIVVNSDGDAGIGTTSPDGKLQIIDEPADASGTTLVLGPIESGKAHLRLGYNTTYSWIQSHGARPLAINSIGNNVGIGNTSPREELEVTGVLRIEADPSNCNNRFCYGDIYHAGADGLIINSRTGGTWAETRFQANGVTKMFLSSAGDLGIGTDTPRSKAEINGELRVTSTACPGCYGIIRHDQADGLIINSHTGGSWAETRFQTNGVTRMFLSSGGNLGIGTDTPQAKLDVNGTASVNILQITGGADLSEQFDVRHNSGETSPEPGMVVCIDADNHGELTVCDETYDKTVAGILSGAGGINPGMLMGQANSEADGKYPVALTGRVYVWADAANGAIQPGDLLTTADIPGHAMKVSDYDRAQGAILGKAMSSLDEGRGLVLVLVSLQ